MTPRCRQFPRALCGCVLVIGMAAAVMAADEDSSLARARRALQVSPLSQQSIHPIRLSLDACIRLALQHNAKVRAGDYAVSAAEAQLAEAYATGWPVFEYEYQTAPVPRVADDAAKSFFRGDLAWHSRGKIAMGIPLYAFGKLRLAQELAKQGIAAAREQQGQEQTAVVAKIRQLYYGIQLSEQIAHLLNDAIRRLSEKIFATDISPVDRLRLRSFRAELEKRLTETRMKEELALEGLRIQIGLTAGTAITLTHTQLVPVRQRLEPLAVYQQAALAKRPESLLTDVGVHAKRLQYELERRKVLPDVGLGGFFEVGRTVPAVRNLSTTDDFTNPFDFTRAGLGIQLKGKFDPHGQRARVTKAKSEYVKASIEQGLAKEGIQLEIRESYRKAQYALIQMRRTAETQKIARQLLFLTKSNFELDVGEKQEYADALQLALLTETQYYEAVFHYNVALAELEQRVGLVPAIADEPQ